MRDLRGHDLAQRVPRRSPLIIRSRRRISSGEAARTLATNGAAKRPEKVRASEELRSANSLDDRDASRFRQDRAGRLDRDSVSLE